MPNPPIETATLSSTSTLEIKQKPKGNFCQSKSTVTMSQSKFRKPARELSQKPVSRICYNILKRLFSSLCKLIDGYFNLFLQANAMLDGNPSRTLSTRSMIRHPHIYIPCYLRLRRESHSIVNGPISLAEIFQHRVWMRYTWIDHRFTKGKSPSGKFFYRWVSLNSIW